MKFMKLGSKPDLFQTNSDNIRYVATELASDVIISIGDVKFYLHKFPLLSKSARLQKLAASTNEDTNNEIHLHDFPGGPIAFEICAKFCYGMTVTLNAYNVVAARCASEYLKMYETIEKGNLIYKIEVFLNSSVFYSWKDSIIVLQTTKCLLPLSEELKVVSHCLDSISTKVSIDTSKVEWSYTYNRKRLPSENGNDDFYYNATRQQQIVPKDWWVEDLCELQLDSYKQVITTIKKKGMISNDMLGESLKAYTLRRLPGFTKGIIQGDLMKNQLLVESISWLLPTEKGTVPCSFLLMLLKAALLLECGEMVRRELIRTIGLNLDEATMTDLWIRLPADETIMYDVDIVKKLVEEFMMQEKNVRIDSHVENVIQEITSPCFVSEASKVRVAKLVDGYLTEVARDPNLPLLMFVNLAEMISGFPRPSHDGLYRAIDMYLKGHPEISKSEKKRICRLMDCKKLSEEACTHAVQNERLPMRVVVQVLFFEQVRAASSSSGSATPDPPVSIKALLPSGSHGSSRSTTTNTEEDWDVVVPIAEEIKALKGGLASYKNKNMNGIISKAKAEKVAADSKMKNLVMTRKMFSKLWSTKGRSRDSSSSDTSGSTTAEEMKSTPSRSSKHSQS